jgi:hypothetical protein
MGPAAADDRTRFLADAEFELDLVGFETSEIEFHLDGDDASQKTDAASREALAAPEIEGPSITRPRDVWILGDHRPEGRHD